MNRLSSYTSLFGANWLLGRHLIPTLQRLGAEEGGDVLDLACGESPFRGCFPKARSFGRVDREPLDAGVVTGDMLAIPFPAESFDVVLLFQAITDVPRMADVLVEVRRVLRPGGRLILFESMGYPEHDIPHDYYRLMPQGLRFLAEETGFEVAELLPLGGLFGRFAMLSNTFLMGGVMRYSLLRPLGRAGILLTNLICHGMDRIAPHPRLASDYLAVLKRLDANKVPTR